MKYKLKTKPATHRFSVTCTCGDCNTKITIDESAKEDFKELMNWDNVDWNEKTEPIKDALVEVSAP